MIDEQALRALAHHGNVHEMGLCLCPCYDALIELGKKLREELELAAAIGSVSPTALAALLGADLGDASEEDEE